MKLVRLQTKTTSISRKQIDPRAKTVCRKLTYVYNWCKSKSLLWYVGSYQKSVNFFWSLLNALLAIPQVQFLVKYMVFHKMGPLLFLS